MSNEPLPFWTRTGNHVTWARSTCSSDAKGGRCGLSAPEIRSHLESYKNGRTSKGFLLIGESTASACTAWHWHQQLVHLCPPARKESASKTVRPVTIPEEKEDAQQPEELREPLTLLAVRCVGATFDSVFIGDLYRSLLSELRPDDVDPDPVEDWSEMLRRISIRLNGARLILVIRQADRLRSTRSASIWNGMSVPESIFLVATSQAPPSNLGQADCPLRIVRLEGSGAASCGQSIQTLTQLEQKFPAHLISRTALLIDRTPLGIAERDLAPCLRRMGLEDEPIDQLPSLIQSLDPLLMRVSSVEVDESLLFWNCPACQAAARSRYSLEPDPIRQMLIGQTEELGSVLRLLINCLEHPVDLQTVWKIVFDWNIWKMLAQAGTFTFVQTIIRRAAVSFLDSQVWIMERALDSIQRSMAHLCNPQHLAAQLVAHLKPFADEENHRNLYALYRGAWTFCEQAIDPVLVPVATSLHYLASPLIRKGVECPDGIQLMTASPDAQTVITVIRGSTEPLIWRSTSAPGDGYVASLKGHSRPVTCLHVTSDNRWLVTGSEDLSVIVWDLQSATLIRRIREHIASVLCVTSTASPDSSDRKMIISGGEDSIIQVSSVASDGGSGCTPPDDSSTGEGHDRVARIDHHRGPVTCAVVNHRNDVLVSGSQDGHVCLWSVDDWSLLNVIHVGNPVGHVSLSSDDVFLLIVGDEDGLPRLHSLTTGSLLRTWVDLPCKVTGAVILGGNGHSIAALSASDGRMLCCDCHSGQLIYCLPHEADQIPAIRSCAARSRDSRLLFHAVGKAVRIWMLTYEEKKPFSVQHKENQSHVTAVAMSPDGSVIVTGRNDGNVTLWRSTSLSRMVEWNHRNAAVTAVAFDSAAGAYVASAAEDGTVASRHLDTGKMLDPTTIHTSRILQLEVLGDWSASAVSCDVNGTLIQWRIHSGEIIRHWQWMAGCSKILAATRNARYVAGSSGNHSVRLWSLETTQGSETPADREVGQFTHSEEVLCLTLTSDSRYLITGSKDCSLKMWQLDNRKLVQVMAGHNDHVTAVACTSAVTSSSTVPSSPASQTKWLTVVSGSRDRQLIVWDAVTGSEIHTLDGHRSSINCLRVSGDGTVVVSGSEDGVLRVWNIKTGVCLSTFSLGNAIHQMVAAQDMSRIVIRTSRPCPHLTVLDLLRTPAVLVKMSAACEALPGPAGPSRPASPAGALPSLRKPLPSLRLLKKEISLDSYTWLKRYGRSNSQSSNSAHAAPLAVSHHQARALDLQLQRRNSFCNVPEASEKS